MERTIEFKPLEKTLCITKKTSRYNDGINRSGAILGFLLLQRQLLAGIPLPPRVQYGLLGIAHDQPDTPGFSCFPLHRWRTCSPPLSSTLPWLSSKHMPLLACLLPYAAPR
ncbi:hypothetical protein GOP47_0004542 [Adiantum capillus-veneris]|uniref:Uncharacterized protein n=1 Tax=Adiantum capillus-veneris TaxID=13818 RepID=A0A9D4V7R2_ADICA|nr:hypothetical protein GOP47_0004542 [Adiantum capillus-veneris]